jgi:hypothetical protein
MQKSKLHSTKVEKITENTMPNGLNNFDLGKFIKMTLLESNFKANIKGTGFNPKQTASLNGNVLSVLQQIHIKILL